MRVGCEAGYIGPQLLQGGDRLKKSAEVQKTPAAPQQPQGGQGQDPLLVLRKKHPHVDSEGILARCGENYDKIHLKFS